MMEPLAAVLFDLDGTLVDTIPLILACYEHTLRAHLPGYDPGRRVIIANLGRSLDDILFDYARGAGVADAATTGREMLKTYRAFQRVHLPLLIRPYDGIREMLAGLKGRGLTLGVVTSKGERAARETYGRYGLDEFLSVEVFHDDTERHKPDPEPLLHAAKKGGLEVARTVYVGDSVHDMAAGKAAGMRTIGALWGPSGKDELLAAGADLLADEPGDVVRLIGSI